MFYQDRKIQSIAFIIFTLSFFCCGINGYAKEKTLKTSMKAGIITFELHNQTATTKTTWSTEGFTVKNKKTDGFPMDQPYGSFILQNGQKRSEVKGNETVTFFVFPKKMVTQQLEQADVTSKTLKQTNGMVYLNAQFRISENGNRTKEQYFVRKSGYSKEKRYFKSIEEARNWKKKDDFRLHFDIPVKYHAGNAQEDLQPISIQYQEKNGGSYSIISTKCYPKQQLHSAFLTDSGNLPETIVSQIDPTRKLNLYEVYYVNTKGMKDAQLHSILKRPKKERRTTKINPNTAYENYKVALQQIQNREFDIEDGGIQIVALYQNFSKKDPIPEEEDGEKIVEQIEQPFIEPEPEGVIQAEKQGKESFDVTLGIPSGENLDTCIHTPYYLQHYLFIKKAGKKVYSVPVQKTYTLHWTTREQGPPDKKGNPTWHEKSHTRTETKSKTYLIERSYAYWEVRDWDLYEAYTAKLENEVLPRKSVSLKTEQRLQNCSYQKTRKHVIEPSIKTIHLPPERLEGGESEPSIPQEDWESIANQSVDQIKVKNDEVRFMGEIYMSAAESVTETKRPERLPECKQQTQGTDFHKSALPIAKEQPNGFYQSQGSVCYHQVLSATGKAHKELSYELDRVNGVKVHTPVVCMPTLSGNAADNQMIHPDVDAVPLVLDRSFTIQIATEGQHLPIPGYGQRDYASYIEKKQVKFPFDVYQDHKFYPKETWITIEKETTFYLPIWVVEGNYEVACRCISQNARKNKKEEMTEEIANYELTYYTATAHIPVQISGRLYGFCLYDISDYPTWQSVFRKEKSLERKEMYYYIGKYNQNGVEQKAIKATQIMPLLRGSHPTKKTAGILKPGYVTRFRFTTVGTMWKENDAIQIKPHFYWIDSNGKHRTEVDLYYTEQFLGKQQRMVKVGSSLDQKNVKYMQLGDSYVGIPKDELRTTATLSGRKEAQWKLEKNPLFTFGNIKITKNFRMFVGENARGSMPKGRKKEDVIKAMQYWYGYYYLPSKILAVQKNFNVNAYAKQHGKLDGTESFWKKEGYIILQFQIQTIQNGSLHLSYQNETGMKQYCDMWQREGFIHQRTDSAGKVFSFQKGDFLVYDLKHTAAKDYQNKGTH